MLTVDMGDFQASTFGAFNVSFNGVLQPGLFSFNDGFQNTAVRSFVLDSAAIANANAAGQFVLTLDRNNSSDFVAFDYFKLEGEAVPEPATIAVWSLLGLIGLGYGCRKKRKAA